MRLGAVAAALAAAGAAVLHGAIKECAASAVGVVHALDKFELVATGCRLGASQEFVEVIPRASEQEWCAMACVMDESCDAFEWSGQCKIRRGIALQAFGPTDCEAAALEFSVYRRSEPPSFSDFKTFRVASLGVQLLNETLVSFPDATCFDGMRSVSASQGPEHANFREACVDAALLDAACARWVGTDGVSRCECLEFVEIPTVFQTEPTCLVAPFPYNGEAAVELIRVDKSVATVIDEAPTTPEHAFFPFRELSFRFDELAQGDPRCEDVAGTVPCARMTQAASAAVCSNPLFESFLSWHCAAHCRECSVNHPGSKCLGGVLVSNTTEESLVGTSFACAEECNLSERRSIGCLPHDVAFYFAPSAAVSVCFQGAPVSPSLCPKETTCRNGVFENGQTLSCPSGEQCISLVWNCQDDMAALESLGTVLVGQPDARCSLGNIVESPSECADSLAPTRSPTPAPSFRDTLGSALYQNITRVPEVASSSSMDCCLPESAVTVKVAQFGAPRTVWATKRFPINISHTGGDSNRRRSLFGLDAGTSLDGVEWEVADTEWAPQYLEIASQSYATKIIMYRIWAVSSYLEYAPVDWLLLGSNDKRFWHIIDQQSDFVWTLELSRTFQVDIPEPFQVYRLVVLDVQGDGTYKSVVIDSVLFFGEDEITVDDANNPEITRSDDPRTRDGDQPAVVDGDEGPGVALVIGFASAGLCGGLALAMILRVWSSSSRSDRRRIFLRTLLNVQAPSDVVASSSASGSVQAESLSRSTSANTSLKSGEASFGGSVTSSRTKFSSAAEAIKGNAEPGATKNRSEASQGDPTFMVLQERDTIFNEPAVWLGFASPSPAPAASSKQPGRKNNRTASTKSCSDML